MRVVLSGSLLLAVILGFSCPDAVRADGMPATTRAAVGPKVSQIVVPKFPGSSAVWGATGFDKRGHVWFAVCARDVPLPSAHLYEYEPQSGTLSDIGDIVSELKRLGLWREGEGQQKVHSKIFQAADGHLYFASMDEQEEKEDGSKQSTWGSHLWRLRLPENKWEHLLTAPETLIAVGGTGSRIYALGYFGHVLYQYDCTTGKSRSIHVGSVDGHVSRNFLVDGRDHAYVPRLTRAAGADARSDPAVNLVEFDSDLREVGQTPLAHYLLGKPTATHGITGLTTMVDGSLYFLTHPGYLFRVTPRADGLAEVRELGPFNGKGQSHSASLFTPDGRRYLAGVSKAKDARVYEWLRYDLTTNTCAARPFEVPVPNFPPMKDVLLYGSMTRDGGGDYYVVGTHMATRLPIVLRVHEKAD
ncbi:MAG: hypothetical protein ACHRHE_17305 [Tepidisphaerales bacterium]